MKNKKFVLAAIACFVAVLAVCIVYHSNNKNVSIHEKINTEEPVAADSNINSNRVTESDNIELNNKNNVKKNKIISTSIHKEDKLTKQANLYSELSGSMLPLSAVTLMSGIPANISEKIYKLSETNNIYMIQKHGDKLFIVTDNPANIRHSVEFTEISLINGHQNKTTLGYNDKIQDSNNDIWEYDNDSQRPKRHTKYNTDGDVEFVEVWNYDNDNPVKYEMKDADGKVISLRKETLTGSSNLRVEHLVYDKEGNTKMNVSATYEGADVKRFTYYNADSPSVGGSIFSEYSEDGNKTRETVYTSDLKVKNSYTAKYKDGNREEILILDNQNKEIERLIPNTVSAEEL